MRRTYHPTSPRIASRLVFMAALAALAAQACSQAEPAAPPAAPAAQTTAGGEKPAAQPAPLLGNAASAQMAVEPRQPAPPVDPSAVSSEPSALIQKPQPAPAAANQPQAAPTYVTAPPPAPQREAYPTATSEHWVWAPGYWYWHGGQYVWISGAWIPARRGHVYVSARWVHRGHGWTFVPGGWALSTYDPIVYPVYPYDPFYYGDYWSNRHHHHHHHGHAWHGGRSHDRQFVRPEGSLGIRRIDRGRSSSRVRVRARR
jgi:hypothetical protein